MATGQQVGYICKRGCGPSPLGVGYVSNEAGAYEKSASLQRCACGYSRRPQPGN